ncbi:MAG: LacI family DNA-binding transcriptional regulator [Clostridia bacterium]|nr:LacI family DNA-binding transcriptional regulator [Clostridia bacterium]
MKITLQDIARETGYSVNTVSHALSGKTDISESTRQKIKEAADRLGYVGNYAASSMRTGKSMTVAIIVPDIKNPFFSVVVHEMEQYFFGRGYTVTVFGTDESAELEREAIKACRLRNMDGIIICPTQKSRTNISMLRELGVPYLLVSRHFDSFEDPFVGTDDLKGGYMATRHLIELGHRRIAFFNADQRISCSRDRAQGYRSALADADVEYDPSLIFYLSTTTQINSFAAVEQFFTDHPDCTAVVAFNDIIAFQVINFLHRSGRRVPEDISVIGFDNICDDFIFPLPLTSVSTSKKAMSRWAARMLCDMMRGEAGQHHAVLNSQLLVRETTAKPPKSSDTV